jgi:hypothetical protein
MEIISFAKENNEVVGKYIVEFGKYEGLDFNISKKIKKNVQEGLSLLRDLGLSVSSVVLTIGKHLSSSEKVTPEKIKQIKKYLAKYDQVDLSNKESKEYIVWMLLGGNASQSWTNRLVKQMDERDSQAMSFFATEENIKEEEQPMDKEKDEEVVESVEETSTEETFSQETELERSNESTEESFSEDESDESSEDGEGEPQEMSSEEGESDVEEMSLDAYADVPAMLALLESETDDYRSLSASFSDEKIVDWAVMAKALFAKLKEEKEVSEENQRAYMSENNELKEFKLSVEKEKFDFAVGRVIAEVEKVLPKEKLDEVKEEVKNFSIETFEDFKNKTLAIAFEYSKNQKPEDTSSKIVSYAFPVETVDKKIDSPWG